MSLRRIGEDASRRGPGGWVLIFVLFACLCVTVAIQTLAVVVVCGQRALLDEDAGRTRAERRDEGQAVLRLLAMREWRPMPWAVVIEQPEVVEGSLSYVEESGEWVMRADARQPPDVSSIRVSALVEKGRDGVDLPLAALVAGSVTAGPERASPWLEREGRQNSDAGGSGAETGSAVAYLVERPAEGRPGQGCSIAGLPAPWHLDEGWRVLIADAAPGGGRPPDVRCTAAPESGVALLSAGRGRTVGLPSGPGGESEERPLLVVLTGGADLDARDQGDIYGVLVVDEGDLLLEGTVLHGAAFVSREVAMGDRGKLVYSPAVFRWATDQSLRRARLVPGSREEGTR